MPDRIFTCPWFDSRAEAADRVMAATMGMLKPDIAQLEAARRGR